MLRSIKSIQGYKVHAIDGEIGKVDEFYFDDQTWTVRYLIVDIGLWILGRKVLISPLALSEPDWASKSLSIRLTRQQVKESPDIRTDKPVSRQNEIVLRKYYDWPKYWIQPTGVPTPAMMPIDYPSEKPKVEEKTVVVHGQGGDPHLRRTKKVIGYHIHAEDKGIGHVADFIVDDQSWVIRYMIVDTHDWLPGRQVLVSPSWVESIDYEDSSVEIDLNKKEIEHSPVYDPSAPVNRDYEVVLHDYYGRPKYWHD